MAVVTRMSRVNDALVNVMTGLGTRTDKMSHTQFQYATLDRVQLDLAYRGDWIARKVVDIPAEDATREGRAWQADRSDITKLEQAERGLRILQKQKRALQKARLYGGGALIIGVDQGRTEDPIEMEKVKKGSLKYLHAVSRWELSAGPIDWNLNSPFFGEPSYYERSIPNGLPIRLHPSRVVRFVGAEYHDESLQDGWGDSILQVVADAIKAAGMVAKDVSLLVSEAKIDVLKIPEFAERVVTEEYTSILMKRLELANLSKSAYHMLVMDSAEEWERINQNFTQLPEILNMYLLLASGAADIPATRMLGQSPQGMNATGESDIRNYYDKVKTEQTNEITPATTRLDEVLIRSALGGYDEGIFYEWNPLWQLDEEKKATIAKTKADTFNVDVAAGILPLEVLREGRQNQVVEDGVYPGAETILEELKEDKASRTDPTIGLPSLPAEPPISATQLASIQAIVVSAVGGEVPPDTARQLISIGFPMLPEEKLNALMAPVVAAARKKEEEAADQKRMMQQQMAAEGGQPPKPGQPKQPQPPQPPQQQEVTDAIPRTLYVHRKVLNVKDITAWAREQGIKITVPLDDLHVTVMYSRTPVDWMQCGHDYLEEGGGMRLPPGGPRMLERLGAQGEALALLFSSPRLSWRHQELLNLGAVSDWPDYQPHITLSYDGYAGDLRDIEPYQGELVLGPEIFQEIVHLQLDGGFGPNQPRDPNGRGASIGEAVSEVREEIAASWQEVISSLKAKHGSAWSEVANELGEELQQLFPGKRWSRDYDPNQPRDPAGTSTGGQWSRASALREADADREQWPEHIKQIKVPPAWTDVRINDDPDGELLVIGKDAKGRSQYVYSAKFAAERAKLKFERIKALDAAMQGIEDQIRADLGSTDLRRKEHAQVTALIAETGLRPGSTENTGAAVQAYGASTLLGSHVVDTDDGVSLQFVGKKGVNLTIPVTDPEVSAMLKQRRDEAGQDGRLFPSTTQSSLGAYVSSLGGGGFKTKDLRTLKGTTLAREKVKSLSKPKSAAEYKKRVREVAVAVSKALGNTPTVALQAYINPSVFAEWQDVFA